MYIVTRTFRDANGVFSVGSIVEPTEVRAFKSRLQQRHIVDVSEQNIEKWALYFLNKFGIDLRDVLNQYVSEDSAPDAPQEAPHEAPIKEATNEAIEESAKQEEEEEAASLDENTDATAAASEW